MDKCRKACINWVNNIPLFYCMNTEELCPYGRYCSNELIPKMGGNYVSCVELNKVVEEEVLVKNVKSDVIAEENVVVKRKQKEIIE